MMPQLNTGQAEKWNSLVPCLHPSHDILLNMHVDHIAISDTRLAQVHRDVIWSVP